jgi:uncharacterized phiE125 gp8 family phage protein
MIEVGDPIPDLGTLVYDSTGTLAAGGAVQVSIVLPDQTVVSSPGTLTVANPSTGRYTSSYVTTMAGPHIITWTVTGANAGVFRDTINVDSPATGIVSLSEVKTHLRIRTSSDDDLLRDLIAEASDLCEGPEGTGRTWRRTVVTDEIHDAVTSFTLNRTPILSLTAITVDGVSQTLSDYSVDLSSGILSGDFGYSTVQGTVKVSYIAGVQTIPNGLRTGVKEMVRHLYMMTKGGSKLPSQGEPDYTDRTAGYLIPNRVVTSWRAYAGTGLG